MCNRCPSYRYRCGTPVSRAGYPGTVCPVRYPGLPTDPLAPMDNTVRGPPPPPLGPLPQEVLMLEWIDDVHLLETQAWGAPINYEIAAPLLRDAVASLTAAAGRGEGGAAGGAAARLGGGGAAGGAGPRFLSLIMRTMIKAPSAPPRCTKCWCIVFLATQGVASSARPRAHAQTG